MTATTPATTTPTTTTPALVRLLLHRAPLHRAPLHRAPLHRAPLHRAPLHRAHLHLLGREADGGLEVALDLACRPRALGLLRVRVGARTSGACAGGARS